MITYNKLIRDKIPEIIEKTGKKYETRVLTNEEYDKALKKKLIEEAKELSEAKSDKEIIDELADVKELFDTIRKNHDISMKQIEKRQKDKNASNGAFEKRLFLIRTEK